MTKNKKTFIPSTKYIPETSEIPKTSETPEIPEIPEISESLQNNMNNSQIVPYKPPLFDTSKPFIQININEVGLLAGAIAASISYTATHTTINATGFITSTIISKSGILLGKAAKYTIGSAAEIAVSFTADAAAATAKETLQLNSNLAAVAVSAAVGTTTALAVTLGSSIIKSSISIINSTSNYIYSQLPSKNTIYSYVSLKPQSPQFDNNEYDIDKLGIEELD